MPDGLNPLVFCRPYGGSSPGGAWCSGWLRERYPAIGRCARAVQKRPLLQWHMLRCACPPGMRPLRTPRVTPRPLPPIAGELSKPKNRSWGAIYKATKRLRRILPRIQGIARAMTEQAGHSEDKFVHAMEQFNRVLQWRWGANFDVKEVCARAPQAARALRHRGGGLAQGLGIFGGA